MENLWPARFQIGFMRYFTSKKGTSEDEKNTAARKGVVTETAL